MVLMPWPHLQASCELGRTIGATMVALWRPPRRDNGRYLPTGACRRNCNTKIFISSSCLSFLSPDNFYTICFDT